MFRKVTLVSLVLFGLLLSWMAGECFADASAGLEQAKSNISSLIEQGDYTQAQEQTQKLLADFSKNPALPEALYKIAERYRWSNKSDKYECAKGLYQQIIANFPDSPSASKASLGIAKVKVLSLIVARDSNGAKEALDELVANFSNHPDFPEELYWIGRGFGYWEKYEEEKAISQRILQNYPDSPFASKAKLAFSRANVQSLIVSQDYDRAKEALDKLIADFSNHPDFPEELYWLAGRYKWSDKYEQAQSLYQLIIQNYPDNRYANKAKLGISIAGAMSLVASHKHEEAIKALDKLMTDFAGHPDTPKAALDVPEPYLREALQLDAKGLGDQAKVSFRRALAMSEMVKTRFPGYVVTADTLYWIGISHHAVGDYEKSIECCQKIVDDWPGYARSWHAQFLIGCNYEQLKAAGGISKEEADAKAEAAYERLLEKYPDCPSAGTAQQWLAHRNLVKERNKAK